MKAWKKHLKDRKGQAAVEFMMVAVVLFFFLLFFLSLSILLVVSEYIDYATFMAARTYKTGASRETKQRENAKLVFDTYTNKIQGIARNIKLEFDVRTDPNSTQTAGLLATYDMDLFYLPPIFSKTRNPSRISLSAESHLGRDPSFEECQNFFLGFIRRAGAGFESVAEQMEDNGC